MNIDEGYYITDDGEKHVILHYNQYVDINGYYCDDFIISYGIWGGYINFLNKKIIEINLPSGYYSITYNKGILKKLTVADDLYEIECENNNVEELSCGYNISYIDLEDNPIKKLNIRDRRYHNNLRIMLSMDSLINPYDYPNCNLNYY